MYVYIGKLRTCEDDDDNFFYTRLCEVMYKAISFFGSKKLVSSQS